MPTVRLTVQAYTVTRSTKQESLQMHRLRANLLCALLPLSLSLVVSRSRIPPSTKKKTNASYKSQFLDLIPALSLSASLLFLRSNSHLTQFHFRSLRFAFSNFPSLIASVICVI